MANVTTLPELYHPLMRGASLKLDRCAVCGRVFPLNQHHVVFRSQGELYDQGRKVKKPTVTLCGLGNDLHGTAPDGTRVAYCHGKAHHHLLHFRWVEAVKKGAMGSFRYGGHWECLETEEPTKYQDALEMEGWRRL